MPDSFIFQEVPWLRTGIAWFLAAGIVIAGWFLLSGPAFVLAGAMRELSVQLSTFVGKLTREDQDRFVNFRQGLRKRFSSFLATHKLLELRRWNPKLWRAALHEFVGPIPRRGLSSLERLARSTERFTKAVERHAGPYSPVTPPPAADAVAPLRAQATKWFFAQCFAAPLVLAIMTVNTGALSRVLQEMEIGLFPLFGGLSLYHVFAFLLTATEAGVGIWWGVSRLPASMDEDENQPMGSLLPPVFATGFACVEGFFYSRFGIEAETPPLVIGDFEFGMQNAFFLLGFFLPLVLFALGDILFRAIVSYRQCHIPRLLSAELRKNILEASRRESQLKAVETHLSRVRVEAQRAMATLQEPTGTGDSGYSQRLSQLEVTLAKLEVERPSWAESTPVPLSEAGAEQYAFRIGVGLLLVAGAAVFAAWIHAATLPGRYFVQDAPGGNWIPSLGPWLAGVISLAKTASLLTAGLFLRSRTVALDDHGQIRPLYGSSALGTQIVGLAIVLVILGFDGWQLAGPDTAASHRLAWGAVFVADLATALLGRELPSMLALLAPILGVTLDGIGLVFRSLLRRVLALLAGLFALAVGVVQLLGEPWARMIAKPR